MLAPKAQPVIVCMPNFRVMEEYRPWDMLGSVLGSFFLDDLRTRFWNMYKSAVEAPGVYKEPKERDDLTLLFESVTNVVTASFIIAKERGFTLREGDPKKAFFPLWTEFDCDPWAALAKIFNTYHLDEIRRELWMMYKAAIRDKVMYRTKEDRFNLLYLFERLTDLVTAAYVIACEKYQSETLS